MTLLQPEVPTLSVEDNFRLTYNGTYGAVIFEKETNTNRVEQVKGELPAGKFVWDGTDHLGGLKAGETLVVPFDLVRVYFGDPRSIMSQRQRFEDRKGHVGDIAPREEETRRLSVLYGVYDTDADKVGQMVPDCTIRTADDEEIVCPANDPLGKHVYGHIAKQEQGFDLATKMAYFEKELALLKEQQAAEGKRGTKNDGADVAVDEPPKP